MKKIGRKIYFDLETGNVILDTGERQGSVKATTVEQDIKAYSVLSERNRETFDVIELPYGAFNLDFSQSSGYHVDVETKEVIFTYREVGEDGEEVEITPSKPLSTQVEELNTKLESQDSMIKNQEQAIAELSAIVTMGMM